MAVANTKSTIVTNADASPRKMTSAKVSHGRLREAVATVETLAADDAESLYRLFRVKSNWRISSLEIGHDAVTAMNTADIGIWQTADNGGAVVDANYFGSAVDMTSAAALTDRMYEATATEISEIEKELWQLLDLTADPEIEYDIGVIATTTGPSVPVTISGRLRYVAGD